MCAHMAGLAGAWRVYTHCVPRRGHRPAANALAARQRTANQRRRGDAPHLRDTASRTARAKHAPRISTPRHYMTRLKNKSSKQTILRSFAGQKAQKSPNNAGLREYHPRIAGRKSAMHPPPCVYTHGVYSVRAFDAVRRERACRASAGGKQTASR